MSSFEYKIIPKNRIEYIDEKVLLYLYQPIVGSDAITLYKLLIQEIDLLKSFKTNVYLNADRLIKILSFNSEDEFFDTAKKLEGMNLLETKKNLKDNKVIFSILSPIDACDFFENPIFNSYLCKKMGNENFEITQFIFRDDNSVSSEDFLDTTENFADIFSDALISEDIAESKKIKSSKFNKLFNKQYEEFLYKAKQNGFEEIINNKTAKKVIKLAMDIYTLDNDDYIEIVNKLLTNKDEKFDKNKFNELCLQKENSYKIQNDSKNYGEIKKSKLAKKIVELSTEESDNYAKLLLKENTLDEHILNMISILKNEYLLDDALINAIMEFSYYKNEGKIVPNYIYKIANTINEKNIIKLEDVMDHLKVAYKGGRKNSNKYIPKIEQLNYDNSNTNYKASTNLTNEDLLNWDGE